MNLVGDKPKQSASAPVPAAAKANKALFFTKVGRKTRQLTVAEVYEKIDAMIDTRLDRYEACSTSPLQTRNSDRLRSRPHRQEKRRPRLSHVKGPGG